MIRLKAISVEFLLSSEISASGWNWHSVTRGYMFLDSEQWEEAVVPGENARIHRENMQTPHRTAPAGSWTWNPLAVRLYQANSQKNRKKNANQLNSVQYIQELWYLLFTFCNMNVYSLSGWFKKEKKEEKLGNRRSYCWAF